MSSVTEAEPSEKVQFQVLIYSLILSVNYAAEEFKQRSGDLEDVATFIKVLLL